MNARLFNMLHNACDYHGFSIRYRIGIDLDYRLVDDAQLLESLGYDALMFEETKQDPFVCLGIAAQATKTLGLGTAVAIAFPRSPAVTALSVPGVHWVAGGVLGFGRDGSVGGPVQQWHMAHPPRSLAQCLGGRFIAAQPGHFWRKSLFDRHGLFDESYRYLFDIQWYARLRSFLDERCDPAAHAPWSAYRAASAAS